MVVLFSKRFNFFIEIIEEVKLIKSKGREVVQYNFFPVPIQCINSKYDTS